MTSDGYPDEAIRKALLSGALAKVLTIALTMVTLGLAARELGPADFGVLSVFVAAATFFGFLDLGFGSASINLLSAARAKGDHAEMRALLTTLLASIVVAGLLLGVVLTCMGILLANEVSGYLGVGEGMIRGLCLTFAAVVALGLIAAVLPKVGTALERSQWNAWALLGAAATSAALSWLGMMLSSSAPWFLVSILGPPSLASLVLGVFLLRTLPGDARPGRRAVSRSALLLLLRRGPAFMVLALVGAVSFQSGPLILGGLLPAQEVGVFAITARMFTVVSSVFAIGLQQVWGTLAAAFSKGDVRSARRVAIRWGRFVFGCAALLTLVLLVCGKQFVRWWAGPELVPSLPLLAVSSLWSLYVVVMTYLGAVLNAAGKVGVQAAANILMACAAVPLGIVSTIQWGSVGVIVGALVAHMLFVAPVVLRGVALALKVEPADEAHSPEVEGCPP